MISITSVTTTPPSLESKLLTKQLQDMARFYRTKIELRRQQKIKFDWEPIEKAHDEIAKHFNYKCVYCETLTERGVIDNFRPKNGVKDLHGKFYPDHYWWLVYDTRNLYYSCEECSRNKGSFFPLDGSRAKTETPYEEVLEEKNLIIDPANDSPERHLSYLPNGYVRPRSRKGEATIELLKLNRPTLVKARKKSYDQLKPLFSKTKQPDARQTKFIHDVVAKDSPIAYAGFLKWHFVNTRTKFSHESLLKDIHLDIAADLGVSIKRSFLQKEERSNVDNFAITKVEILNFKCIGKLTIDFPKSSLDISQKERRQPWLMMLGENGMGKSSCLQAIALALVGSSYLRKLKIDPLHILKRGTTKGYVKVFHHGGSKPITLEFSKRRITNKTWRVPPIPILGYGSTRLYPFGNLITEESTGKVRAMNLFKPDYALTDAYQWILDMHKSAKQSKSHHELFDWIGRAIKELLLLKKQEKLVVKRGKVLIAYSKSHNDSLDQLSDGYKSVLAMTADITKTLLEKRTSVEFSTGIVFIDEIGTHLHPRWRMQVINRLRSTFPMLQFIVTTHDPLCLKGLVNGEVIVVDRNSRHRVYVKNDLPDPSLLNAEQLLGSEFFGLKSTIDPDVEEKFNEYHYLISRKKLTSIQQKTLNDLEKFVRQKQHVGNSEYERVINKVIHEEIAKNKFVAPKTNIELNKGTIKRINEILDKL